SNGRGGITAGRAGVLALVALVCGAGAALAGDPPGKRGAAAGGGPGAEAKSRSPIGPATGAGSGAAGKAETVYFADPGRAPVQVMRGNPASPGPNPAPAAAPAREPAVSRTETVSFGP